MNQRPPKQQAAVLRRCTAAVFLATAACAAQAQSSWVPAQGQSWLPYTTSGYVGIALGQGRYEDGACVAGFGCDKRSEWAGKIYTGGQVNPWLGAEIGYVHFGRVDRNGGDVRAQGVAIDLVGRLPLAERFSLSAKIGGTYGWTDSSASALAAAAGAPDGDENGFGWNAGVGAAFHLDRNWSLTLEWERHRLKFADDDRRDVDLASFGVAYRF